MGAESEEKSENGYVNNEDEKPKIDDLKSEEAQQEKIPYPKSVFFIVGNEFCERFSFYGMRTILSLYLKDILLYSESDSTVIYHTFTMFAYFFPLLGAIIADSWLGKFKTILYVSIIYACGNILLALSSVKPIGIPQAPFSLLALFLIAMGTGGIKPCVAAFGGDQFVLPQQELQLAAFFSVFYFSINAGSLISTFLTPVLREDVHCFGDDSCYPLAFAVPGVLMLVSIAIFFLGSRMYKIREPKGNVVVQVSKCIWYGAKKNMKSKEKVDHWLDHAEEKYGRTLVADIKVLLRVLVVFIPLPIFWTLYDQQGSAWTFQAARMDGRVGSWTILPDQMQVINPVLILLFIPLFTYGVYPLLAKFGLLKTPLQKMVCGGFLAAAAFGISAGVSAALEATYPDLPTDGACQLRIYNPSNVEAVLKIDDLKVNEKVGSMGYSSLNLDCSGTKNYSYTFEHDLYLQGKNSTGFIEMSEATGYVIYPSTLGLILLEDDIAKPDDGLPKIRTLFGNPSTNYNTTYYDDGDIELEIPSGNYSLVSIDPGTYKLGNKDFDFELGGVYTVLVQLSDDGSQIKNSALHVVTTANSIHIFIQIPQYVIITAAEIMFSITGLEFSYAQAPASMKSVIQSANLLTDAIGNLIIVIIESLKIFNRASLDYTLYTGIMVADMILFAFLASRYKYVEKDNKLDESEERNDDKTEKKLSIEEPKE